MMQPPTAAHGVSWRLAHISEPQKPPSHSDVMLKTPSTVAVSNEVAAAGLARTARNSANTAHMLAGEGRNSRGAWFGPQPPPSCRHAVSWRSTPRTVSSLASGHQLAIHAPRNATLQQRTSIMSCLLPSCQCLAQGGAETVRRKALLPPPLLPRPPPLSQNLSAGSRHSVCSHKCTAPKLRRWSVGGTASGPPPSAAAGCAAGTEPSGAGSSCSWCPGLSSSSCAWPRLCTAAAVSSMASRRGSDR